MQGPGRGGQVDQTDGVDVIHWPQAKGEARAQDHWARLCTALALGWVWCPAWACFSRRFALRRLTCIVARSGSVQAHQVLSRRRRPTPATVHWWCFPGQRRPRGEDGHAVSSPSLAPPFTNPALSDLDVWQCHPDVPALLHGKSRYWPSISSVHLQCRWLA